MSDANARRGNFKFNSLTTEELRRRREETQVELRKSKREMSLNKRRQLVEGEKVSEPPILLSTPQASNSPSVPRARDLYASPSPSELAQRLPEMVQSLYSQDIHIQYQACVEFRKALSKEKNAPIQEVIDCNVVGRFVEMLQGLTVQPTDETQLKQQEEIIFEAAWVLTNIASGEPSHTMSVVNANAVPHFVSLLRHHNADIREQCIWALGNICGDGPRLRNHVIENGIIPPLLENLNYSLEQLRDRNADNQSAIHSAIGVLRNGAWAISNLCRGTPAPAWEPISTTIPFIARLLTISDEDTLVDVAWALAYITTESSYTEHIVNSGIVPLVVPLLKHSRPQIQIPALRAIGNIVTGKDTETQAVIDAGALIPLESLLFNTRPTLVKEACWAISNITAGTPSQIQAVLDMNGIVSKLLRLLSVSDFRVKREACWAICNATSAYATHPQQVNLIVEKGAIKPLCEILEAAANDARVILVALDGISNILAVGEALAMASHVEDPINKYAQLIEECGGLTIIMQLQEHPENEVYIKSKAIIDRFYDGQDEGIFDDDDANFIDVGANPETADTIFSRNTPLGDSFHFDSTQNAALHQPTQGNFYF